MARRGALLLPFKVLLSVPHFNSRINISPILDWWCTVSSELFDTQTSSISIEGLALCRYDRCVLSRLHCNGRSLTLTSYLSRIGRIGNPSCGACGHPTQDTSYLILHYPATDFFAPYALWLLSVYLCDLYSRPWRFSRLLGPMVFRHVLISRKGLGSNKNIISKTSWRNYATSNFFDQINIPTLQIPTFCLKSRIK